MTEVQEPQAAAVVVAPPRRPVRWLGVVCALFVLAIVVSGTGLVAGVPSPAQGFVIFFLIVALLAFAAIGIGLVPPGADARWLAGLGVLVLGVALIVSWTTSSPRPSGQVRIEITGQLPVCGEITAMDQNFVTVTQKRDGPKGADGVVDAVDVTRLVPVAAITSIMAVNDSIPC